MNVDQIAAISAFTQLLGVADTVIWTAMAVFARVGALVFFLPGMGEQFIPARVKLVGALAFTAIVAPIIVPIAPPPPPDFAGLAGMIGAEALSGLLLGLGIRFLVFALQIAGFIAAQSLSLSQLFSGVMPDPEPALSSMLTLGGIALAMTLGLHVKVAALLVASYDPLPFGAAPIGSDVGAWTARRAAEAFSLGVSIAIPFVLVAFMYHLAIGLINKAMPSLMVTFVGMPFITWAGILIFGATATYALVFWHTRFDAALLNPLAITN